MGRIVTSVTVSNVLDRSKQVRLDALVDTGATYLTLPSAWKERLEPLETLEVIELQTATQQLVQGEVCAPVRIEVEGFRPVVGEVLFIDMQPRDDGQYDPLLGYLVLQAIPVAVDMLGHRLVKVAADLKGAASA